MTSVAAWLLLALAAPCSASFVTPPALRECSTRARTICMADAAPLLDVKDLKASVAGTQILNGINLQVKKGERGLGSGLAS